MNSTGVRFQKTFVYTSVRLMNTYRHSPTLSANVNLYDFLAVIWGNEKVTIICTADRNLIVIRRDKCHAIYGSGLEQSISVRLDNCSKRGYGFLQTEYELLCGSSQLLATHSACLLIENT